MKRRELGGWRKSVRFASGQELPGERVEIAWGRRGAAESRDLQSGRVEERVHRGGNRWSAEITEIVAQGWNLNPAAGIQSVKGRKVEE